MRIIFMGTPDFAVASLEALLNAGKTIVAVVTAPDKPSGRGQKLNESAVKQFAIQRGLPVLQPARLKDPGFLEALAGYRADLQVVVAFRMLPEVVWKMPPMGTINLHGSLLPQYRGAAPINWAIINGERETGVTTFMLSHEIDTGDILAAERIPIGDTETAGELHDRMMVIGAKLLVSSVNDIAGGKITQLSQDVLISENSGMELNHAPKLFKEDCLIDWRSPAKATFDKIRGLSPFPTAYIEFRGKTLKIFNSSYTLTDPGIQAGGFLTDGKTFLKFACTDGFISLLEVQMEGKKRLKIDEFLRGTRLD
ncbi:methionyl-tRNA formyltransferase [Hufsiella ginkgonis]|uniref:Methionyl-tRNA formyltransferase n=1 Tax=Hufsiella ginkgonis TaxID=2695274 RepID=A0A7K1XZ00_9SPHI|nr:methionyl-tRNA formyltransferase [Hufsiella ginkgonis]MXV16190.1 methionyl-tRNA formyltransferase [Hufsiella ginkgonis]